MDKEEHSLVHSPFHATKAAYCRTPWHMMSGDERCRSCPTCGGMAYKLQEFPEETFTTMIAETEGIDPAQLHLYRRNDGTFVARNLPCAGSTAGAFQAWKQAATDVLSIIRQTPVWTSVMVVSASLQPLLAATPFSKYGEMYAVSMPFSMLLGLLAWVAQLALTCRISRAMLAKYEQREWHPSKEDFARQRSVGLNSLLFSIVGGSLLWLLVFPGIYFGARAGLAVMFIMKGEGGPLSSFGKSENITRGHTGYVMRTLMVPALLLVATWFTGTALTLLVYWVQRILFNGQLEHPWFAQSLQSLANYLIVLTFLPLQAKLFVELKHKMDAALIKQSANVLEFKKSNNSKLDVKSREQAEH